MDDVSFFRMFCEAEEFKQIKIRQEEIPELESLAQCCVWISVDGEHGTNFWKIAILF